ncbi:MAG: HEAT repeat domain-containing protein [Cyanobacteria bacterium CRU_2_1]|nr:HEAT repeat domain-containing protein [Cyanobacteria bacterium RU_5_0]NJR59921.1 HEAT repeat domain-containing protein [Cyanobacteria bacterium CRU_2_1]
MNIARSQDVENLIEQLRCATTPAEAIALIQQLAQSRDERAIDVLIEMLQQHHSSVVSMAVQALVQCSSAAVEPLIAAFHNTCDHSVQAYIVQALSQSGDIRALNLLIEVVGVEVANHCQGSVRRIAARGLGKIGQGLSEREKIDRIIDKLRWAVFNAEDWALRYAAIVSLQEIGTPEAVTVLQHVLSHESDRVVQERITVSLAN